MTVVEATCTCGSIGAAPEIRRCEDHHRYWFGDKELVSVSKVIRTVYPIDYSRIRPDVLENARIRGQRVDSYFCEYMNTGELYIDEERDDVKDYISRLIPWWEREFGKTAFPTQKITFCPDRGVAGTMDIRPPLIVLDLKCTSQLYSQFRLQVGAYAELEDVNEAGIVHVTEKQIRLKKYDAAECRRQWNTCYDWYKTLGELR